MRLLGSIGLAALVEKPPTPGRRERLTAEEEDETLLAVQVGFLISGRAARPR
jgi:hypothetical protein